MDSESRLYTIVVQLVSPKHCTSSNVWQIAVSLIAFTHTSS